MDTYWLGDVAHREGCVLVQPIAKEPAKRSPSYLLTTTRGPALQKRCGCINIVSSKVTVPHVSFNKDHVIGYREVISAKNRERLARTWKKWRCSSPALYDDWRPCLSTAAPRTEPAWRRPKLTKVSSFPTLRGMSGLCFISPRTEDTIATDMEQATGLERKELEALMQGKEVIPINAHLETVAIFSFYCRIRSICLCSQDREAPVRNPLSFRRCTTNELLVASVSTCCFVWYYLSPPSPLPLCFLLLL